jgi:hypothetical protein
MKPQATVALDVEVHQWLEEHCETKSEGIRKAVREHYGFEPEE